MNVKSIYFTSTFEKHFKKLPISVKRLALKKELIFRDDPVEKSLQTHALKGNLKGYFSFSVNHQYRIVFIFESKNIVTFIDIGTHSIYK